MNYKRKTWLLILLIPVQLLLQAQAPVDTLSRLLLALDDSISIYQDKHLLGFYNLQQVRQHTGEIRLDIDQSKGEWIHPYRICTKGDTFAIKGFSEKALYLPATNGFDTIQVLLNFYNNAPTFSQEYQSRNRSSVQFEIPAVYELVHIAFSLTEAGSASDQIFALQTYYAEEVKKHFTPKKNHPLIEHLNALIANSAFEEVFNNFTMQCLPLTFEGGNIVPSETYPLPYRINPWSGKLLTQLQNFADQTDFLVFFEEYKGYRDKLLHEQAQFVELDSLWLWLEEWFPAQVDGYKVLFSPLASQRADHLSFAAETYFEYVLFLDNPEGILFQTASNTSKKADLLKKAFDEIFPFYHQPLQLEHQDLVRKVFATQSVWLANGLNVTPEEVFRSYMKNAVFCYWAEQNYTSLSARLIRQKIEKDMLEKGFIRFYNFSRDVSSLFRENTDEKNMAEIYRKLLNASLN